MERGRRKPTLTAALVLLLSLLGAAMSPLGAAAQAAAPRTEPAPRRMQSVVAKLPPSPEALDEVRLHN